MANSINQILRLIAASFIFAIIFHSPAISQYDNHLYIGTIDGTPLPVPAHDTVDIPVYISGPRIGGGNIPLYSRNRYISDRLGGNFYLGEYFSFGNPFYWDEAIRQTLTFSPTIWGEGIFHLADFTVVMSADSGDIGYVYDALWVGEIQFSDTLGYYIINPTVHISPLQILGVRGIKEHSSNPDKITLLDSYPNPFNSSTTIRFTLPEVSDVAIEFYDISGRQVRSLYISGCKAGDNHAAWDGSDNLGQSVASGAYFCRISNNENSAFARLMLIK
jgi:hypothetical protein